MGESAFQRAKRRVVLKGVKVFRAMSEETECFTATVYIDGVKVGTVGNHGQGGSDEYYPFEVEQKLNAIPEVLEYAREEGFADFPTCEIFIGALVQEVEDRKEWRKITKDRLVLLDEKGGLWKTGKLSPALVQAKVAQGYTEKGKVLLNGLTEDEGVEVLLDTRKAAARLFAGVGVQG